MKNINNNLISLFAIISIIALNIAFISPKEANAYTTKGSYTICTACGNSNGNNDNNNYNNGNNYYNSNQGPVIHSTNPTKVGANTGLKSITIIGTGFRPDSIARWNLSDRPTSFVNSQKLIMELDKEDTFEEGKYNVTVVNPSPEGGRFSNPKTVIVTSYIAEEVKGVSTINTNSNTGSTNTGSYTVKASTATKSNTNTVAKNTNTTKTTTTNKATTTEKKEEVKGATDEKKEDDTTCATGIAKDDNDNNGLLASSIKGNSSFLPDTIAEWLILIILIILAIVLWRRIWVTRAERNKPLKHA